MYFRAQIVSVGIDVENGEQDDDITTLYTYPEALQHNPMCVVGPCIA